jgi:hypothetical protein
MVIRNLSNILEAGIDQSEGDRHHFATGVGGTHVRVAKQETVTQHVKST